MANNNKQLFLILNGICRLLTLVVAIIVTAVGFYGIHSCKLKNTYEFLQNHCWPANECPTAAYEIIAFQVLAPLTLVCVFLAALVALILHLFKMCGCAWILDAIVQACLALLSLTTGSILIHGANGFIPVNPVSRYGLTPPPKIVNWYKKHINHDYLVSVGVDLYKKQVNYDYLISAGALAIINAFVLVLLVVLIVLSKPDK